MTGRSDRTFKILIAEDESLVAQNIERVLTDAGYTVIGSVGSPHDVLTVLEYEQVDLVLVDIGLGSDDGIELAAQLEVPSVFVSGRTDDETLARARRVGALGFVVKPFSPRQLIATVDLAVSLPAPSTPNADSVLATIAQTLREAGVCEPGPRRDRRPAEPWAAPVPGLDTLSKREGEVLEELLNYRRPPQIATALGISPHTVRNHLKSIYAKLGVHSQTELLELVIGRDP